MIKNLKTIRTGVENLLLKEMEEEDKSFLILGECDDSIIDNMIKKENKLFENEEPIGEDEDDNIIDGEEY